VIQAGAIGRGAEALVLDMGQPIKILDVATRMMGMSGKDVKIVFTGLREGEKLHEDLFGAGEAGDRPLHPLISHVDVPPLDPDDIGAQAWARYAQGRHGISMPMPLSR
jgi:FlaA1/EpsC-like NDP-sugar epimerase